MVYMWVLMVLIMEASAGALRPLHLSYGVYEKGMRG
jgi:hypothetical protein